MFATSILDFQRNKLFPTQVDTRIIFILDLKATNKSRLKANFFANSRKKNKQDTCERPTNIFMRYFLSNLLILR